MADYTDDLALIVRYDGTKADFDAVKSNYLGKVVFIYGSTTEATTDSAKASLLQAVWVSDASGGRYLDMANVDYIRNNLTHISGITVDGKTYYPSSGGGAITLAGANGIEVSVDATTGVVTFDGEVLSKAVASAQNKADAAAALASQNSTTISNLTTRVDGIETTANNAATKTELEDAVAALKSDGSDASSDATIAGAKIYAEEKASEAEEGAKSYADNNFARLDPETGKIKADTLPDFILGQLMFGGIVETATTGKITVDPSANFKDKYNLTIADEDEYIIATTTENAAQYEGVYFVSNASSTDANLPFNIGDWVVSTGERWAIVDNTDAVASVAGLTGTITASALAQKLAATGDANELALLSEVTAKYTKPSTGIPKTDLASAVQTSLGKADSAIQKVTSNAEPYIIATTDASKKEVTITATTTALGEVENNTLLGAQNGLATAEDVFAYLKARLSVKVVS